MDGWMDEWMDGWTDGRTDGRMDGKALGRRLGERQVLLGDARVLGLTAVRSRAQRGQRGFALRVAERLRTGQADSRRPWPAHTSDAVGLALGCPWDRHAFGSRRLDPVFDGLRTGVDSRELPKPVSTRRRQAARCCSMSMRGPRTET